MTAGEKRKPTTDEENECIYYSVVQQGEYFLNQVTASSTDC